MRDLDQRARYPDDWHQHEWFMRRVYLGLVVSVVAGIVAWSLYALGIL